MGEEEVDTKGDFDSNTDDHERGGTYLLKLPS